MLNKLPPAYFTKTQTWSYSSILLQAADNISPAQAMFMKEEETEKEERGISAFYVSNEFCVFMDKCILYI